MNHPQTKGKKTRFIEKIRRLEHTNKVFSLLGAIFCLAMLILLTKI